MNRGRFIGGVAAGVAAASAMPLAARSAPAAAVTAVDWNAVLLAEMTASRDQYIADHLRYLAQDNQTDEARERNRETLERLRSWTPTTIRCGAYQSDSYTGEAHSTCTREHLYLDFQFEIQSAYTVGKYLLLSPEEHGQVVFADGWTGGYYNEDQVMWCPDHNDKFFSAVAGWASPSLVRSEYDDSETACVDCGSYFSYNAYLDDTHCEICTILRRETVPIALRDEFRAWLVSRPDESAELAVLEARFDKYTERRLRHLADVQMADVLVSKAERDAYYSRPSLDAVNSPFHYSYRCEICQSLHAESSPLTERMDQIHTNRAVRAVWGN